MKIQDQIQYIHAHLDRPILIIGMMGAGKTTLARKISEILEWPFLDSDLEIEKDEGVSIKKIFETKGEPFFREKERLKIADLLDHSKRIISVGGGAITNPETAEAIFSKSLCLWVDAPIAVLAQRASRHDGRPLLNGRNAEEALTERMEQRKHLYSQAHLYVDGNPNIDDVTHNAIGQIFNYLLDKTDEI